MAANSTHKKPTSYRKKTTGSSTTKSSKKNTGRLKAGTQNEFKKYHDEIILVVTLVVSILLILSSFHLSGTAGEAINFITFGLFGFFAYFFPYLLFFSVAFHIANRGNKKAHGKLISAAGLTLVLITFMQMLYNEDPNLDLIAYFQESADMKVGGGLLGATMTKILVPLFGSTGTYVILIGTILVLFMFITEKLFFATLGKHGGKTVASMKEKHQSYVEQRTLEAEQIALSAPNEQVLPRKKAKTFTFQKHEPTHVKEHKSESANRIESEESPQPAFFSAEPEEKTHITDIPIEGAYIRHETNLSTNVEKPVYAQELDQKFGRNKGFDIKELANRLLSDEASSMGDSKPNIDHSTIVDEELSMADGIEIQGNYAESPAFFDEAVAEEVNTEEVMKEEEVAVEIPASEKKGIAAKESEEIPAIVLDTNEEERKEYVFPPIDLLTKPKAVTAGVTDLELKETAMKLQSTLESFGVKVTITNVSCGPAVTRYELQPEQGVKVSKITGLADDIKLNLAAADIRIEAPIPGKAAVGIEVPNKTNSAVMFRELIENPEFAKHHSDIAFAVGKDIGGQTVVTDIAKMPHLLIAGATGSGKSVCINTLIMSILYKANPADVKLIMVDPKVVELSVYNGIPHLLIPVVTDPKKASAALNWAVMEMTERYNKFAEIGVRDIKGYNDKIKSVAEYKQDERYKKMPQIVIIVDELADLMMVAPGEVEDAICRLAQMARAAGLHLIIATQRPSVNVITGLIKANIPSRIAFSVSSQIDSRTILDGAGAEKLLGKGDMLFFPSGYPKPVRIQGAFVSDKEVSSVVEFLANQNSEPQYSEDVTSQITSVASSAANVAGGANDRDDYFVEAGRFIIEKDKASIGMLQRVYKIGFNRAARIMDQLADAGVVGPEEGTKPRKVLMSEEEFEQYVEEYV